MKVDAAPLELRDVTSGYGDVPVIRRASMTFHERLITTIVGSNGAGKSTAVKDAAGLLRAWQGSVSTYGIDSTREPTDRRVYRGIAYVPQGRIVVPEMTVRDNLMIGAHILGRDRRAIEAAMDRVLQLFPALKPLMKQHADTMSGGEQQMLAIGRALMTSPKVIMLDEPSLGLSPKYVEAFLPAPVTRATVENLLRLASRSASGSNIQPWRVRVIAGDAKARLTQAIFDAVARDGFEPYQREWNYYPLRWREPFLGR